MQPPQRCFSGDWKACRQGTLPIGNDYSRNWPTAPSLCPVTSLIGLLPTSETEVYRSRGHGRSADTSAILINAAAKRALVDVAFLSVDHNRVQTISLLSTEFLRIPRVTPRQARRQFEAT